MIAGKWRVDALLGSGSMAAVYSVTHRNGARAALKILHPTLCTDPAVCERFLGEGYLTNAVKHPGIVRVLDDGVTDDGCVYLVMDLLEGKTLEALRQERGGQIPLVEVLDIADELMDVLQAVHAAGIIHRDLKPQNVFVCSAKGGLGRGAVKLLDFGVARLFDQNGRNKVSVFGLVLGTPSFMAPEQARGARDQVDHRTDIWSLGATLFTALTGQTVHLGPNVQAKLLAAATSKARSISMVKPDLPAPIAVAIDTALRFERDDRWQSVDAFRRALREARVQVGLGKRDTAPPPTFSVDDAPLPDDPGERALAIMVRTAHAAKTSSRVRAATKSSPGEHLVEGPNGTCIGVAPPAPVHDEVPPTSGPVDDASSSLDSSAADAPSEVEPEVSFPPVEETPKLVDQLERRSGRRRRSGISSVLAVMALGGAAVGGVAFFAVDAGSGGDGAAPPAELGLTSAEVPLASQPAAEAPRATPEIEGDAAAPFRTAAIAAPVRTAHATQPPPVASGRTNKQTDRSRAKAPSSAPAPARTRTDPPPEIGPRTATESEGTPKGDTPKNVPESLPESDGVKEPAAPAPTSDPFGTPE